MSDALRVGEAAAGRESHRRVRWLSAVVLALMTLVAIVLVWRRAAGALGQPLPTESLAAVGVVLAAAALAARWLWFEGRASATSERGDRLILWCPTILLLTIAVAVHLPGTSLAGIVLFWSAVMLEEAVANWWAWRRRAACRPARQARQTPKRGEPVLGNEPNDPLDATGVSPAPDNDHWQDASGSDQDRCCEMLDSPEPPDAGVSLEAPDDQVTQQFVRSHTTEGDDVFSGWLRVQIPPGGRTTNVHVAFCPPFARSPTIEVHQVDGPPGRIKTVQTLPYGTRLDVKLSQSSDEVATVLLRFVARAGKG